MPPLCRPPRPNEPTATVFRPKPGPHLASPASPAFPSPGYRSGAATSVAATFQPDTLITGVAPCRSAES